MSSSLKEKWNRDSQPAWGNARAGGRGRARRAAVERMGAKRCRDAHGDSCTVLWRALFARPEVSAAAASADSTPALRVNPQAGLRAFSGPQRRGELCACLLLRGPAELCAHFPLASLPQSLRAREGGRRGVPRAPVSRAPGPPPLPPLAPPSSLLILTSSWARWRSPSAVRPRGDERPAVAKCEVR